jgi:hypothetical protein
LASVDKGNGTDADGVFRQKSAYTEGLKRLVIKIHWREIYKIAIITKKNIKND